MVVHPSGQHAAGVAHLVPEAKLNAARDDVFPQLVAFPSELGLLAAFRPPSSGDEVANVLMSNATWWGAKGPTVAAALDN